MGDFIRLQTLISAALLSLLPMVAAQAAVVSEAEAQMDFEYISALNSAGPDASGNTSVSDGSNILSPENTTSAIAVALVTASDADPNPNPLQAVAFESVTIENLNSFDVFVTFQFNVVTALESVTVDPGTDGSGIAEANFNALDELTNVNLPLNEEVGAGESVEVVMRVEAFVEASVDVVPPPGSILLLPLGLLAPARLRRRAA